MSLPFRILGINHIGLAPKAPQQTAAFFNLINLPHLGDELVSEQKTFTRMYSTGSNTGSRLEILINQEGEPGPIGSFLEKKGGGIHHIALTVDNINAALNYLDVSGIELIDKTPRQGAHNTRIGFVHPRATGGILVELVEE